MVLLQQISRSKAELRQHFSRATATPQGRPGAQMGQQMPKQMGAQAMAQLIGLVRALKVQTVGAYVPLCNDRVCEPELHLASLAQAGVTALVWPVVDDLGHMHYRHSSHPFADKQAWQQWPIGRFGLPEPTGVPALPDLLLVPGIAFDRRGYRLGQGQGCFDRYLQQHNIYTVGVAWSWQMTGSLPVDTWDQPVGWLLTEEELIQTASRTAGTD